MQKRAKKEVFDLYLEFGTSDESHIAYDDSTKGFLIFGHGKRSCIINKVCMISINYAKKSRK